MYGRKARRLLLLGMCTSTIRFSTVQLLFLMFITVTVASAQEVCTEDFECEGENTQCLLKYVGCSIGTCECRYGYFRTDTNSTCIPGLL